MRVIEIDMARTLASLYAGEPVEVFNNAGGLATYHDLIPAREVRELLARLEPKMFAVVDHALTSLADAESEIGELQERNEQLVAELDRTARERDRLKAAFSDY